MNALKAYTAQGGNVMVTGAYVASDVWDGISSGKAEQTFAKGVLGYEWRVGHAAIEGKAYTVSTPFLQIGVGDDYKFSNAKNDKLYCVESPDGVIPAGDGANTFIRYSENNIPAGIAANMDGYRTVVVGFPFETIECEKSRNKMMSQVLEFFNGASK